MIGKLIAAFPAALLLLLAADPPAPPKQPVPYSHKQHLAMGLQCKNCHTSPDPGETMGLPAVKVCMGCHTSVKTDSPHIQKLARHAADKTEPPWVRVYQIPSYVFFSHKIHLESAAGAKCESCHGPVATREALWKETNISMGACMECHRQNKASNDCTYCHEPRQ
jgi:Zn ribbon nucleic-acid-binding protein